MYVIMLGKQFCRFASGKRCYITGDILHASVFRSEDQAKSKRRYAQKNGVYGPTTHIPETQVGGRYMPTKNVQFDICEIDIVVNIVRTV